ncbi:MAG: class I SAM-dependent methyltransferase [Salinivirgaceae bacterium]|jgi:SAM-dependent methyltransferase|nr:class I SAM-dependent methyltransferase [Salinivirgaceae bacterium]
MTELKKHWNKIYAKKHDSEVSWYQLNPETSLNLIQKYSITINNSFIDIGGGNSNLTKHLCEKKYNNFSVLDISEEAIERCRAKLRKCKGIQELLVCDILDFEPSKLFHIWHDRAVFHFLTEKKDINKYIHIASMSIAHNGYLLLSTFALTGPNNCSGLPVKQYSIEKLEKLFSPNFSLVESFEETHKTPLKIEQNYIWVVLKRN